MTVLLSYKNQGQLNKTFAHILVVVKDREVHFGAFKDNLSNGIVMQPVLKL